MDKKVRNKRRTTASISELMNKNGEFVIVTGMLSDIQEYADKSSVRKLAFAVLSDNTSNVEVLIFPSVYRDSINIMNNIKSVIEKGTVKVIPQESRNKKEGRKAVIIAEKIQYSYLGV